jgi:hypothetical protein
MYDFQCEHCSGIVRERVVDREALRHKGNFHRTKSSSVAVPGGGIIEIRSSGIPPR